MLGTGINAGVSRLGRIIPGGPVAVAKEASNLRKGRPDSKSRDRSAVAVSRCLLERGVNDDGRNQILYADPEE